MLSSARFPVGNGHPLFEHEGDPDVAQEYAKWNAPARLSQSVQVSVCALILRANLPYCDPTATVFARFTAFQIRGYLPNRVPRATL
jgi:hypothetical protein